MRLARVGIVGIVAASLAVGPVIQANAFVAPLALPYIVTAAGTSPMTIAAAAAAAAAGLAVLGLVFKDSGGNDVLDVKLNPKAPERVPAGWTAPPLPGDAPVPPGTAGSITTTYWFANGSGQSTTLYTTPLESCQAFLGSTNCASVSGPYSGPVDGSCAKAVSPRYCAVPANTSIYSNTVTSCPTGYTLSGGSCNLTSAPDVPFPSDGIGRKDCSSGTCGNNARDPDNTEPVNVTGGPGQVKVKQGTSTTTVTVNGDGTVTIKTVVANGDGTSTETVLKTAPPNPAASDGGTNATGTSQKQVTGEGESAEETTTTITCAGGPCATEATQQQVRSAVQTIRDTGVKVVETGVLDGTSQVSTANDAFNAQADVRKKAIEDQGGGAKVTDLGWAFAWTLPTVACESWNFTFRSWSRAVEWCGHLGSVRTLWGWFLGIFTALYIWRSATNAVGG